MWRRAAGRGVFPHQLAWFLELPWRRFLLSPRSLAARLPLRSDSSVLEIGPGSGYYSLEVAKRVPEGHLVLFDLQPEMLAWCRAKCEAAGIGNVECAQGDGAELPFADGRFDLVYMVTVFGEIRDREGCLRSIRRVLKPTGTLSISEHLPDPDFSSLETLRKSVESHGFVLTSRYGPRWAYTANFGPS